MLERTHEKRWLGWLDSNQRMAGSKPAALPLGDTPVADLFSEALMQRRLINAFGNKAVQLLRPFGKNITRF